MVPLDPQDLLALQAPREIVGIPGRVVLPVPPVLVVPLAPKARPVLLAPPVQPVQVARLARLVLPARPAVAERSA